MIVVLNSHDVKRLNAREAVSHIHCLSHNADYSLVKVHIETGRTHQIRVHCAYLGFPVSGDAIYREGGDRHKDWLKPRRHLLHASRIGFDYQGDKIEVESILPSGFTEYLEALKNLSDTAS